MGLPQNIKVKIDTYCNFDKFSDPLPQIIISPPTKSQNMTSGACGIWANQNTHECNYFDANGSCVSFSETNKIMEYWRFDNFHQILLIILVKIFFIFETQISVQKDKVNFKMPPPLNRIDNTFVSVND